MRPSTMPAVAFAISLLAATSAFAAPTPGNGWGANNLNVWIGNFWDQDTNRNYGGVNNSFQWPGGWWDNNDGTLNERRTYANFKGYVLGAKNVRDPQFPNVVWPYMVGQRDGENDGEVGDNILAAPPDPLNPGTTTQILYKGRLARRTFRQAQAVVTVDGVRNSRLDHKTTTSTVPWLPGDEADAPYQSDRIDPTIPADLTFETQPWTRMGIAYGRMWYAFVDRRNDDYMVWHTRLINNGRWGRAGVDTPECCGGTHGTVEGVMMSLMFQWDRSSRGAIVTKSTGQSNNDSIWRYYGIDYDGARTEDMRLVYVIDGDQSTAKFPAYVNQANHSTDDIGDPDPVTGELLSAKTGGWQILHYDVSSTDKHDDPAQPTTLGWETITYEVRTGTHGMQAKYEQMRWGWLKTLNAYYPGSVQETPGRGRHPHADDLGASWIKASNDPATSGAYWPGKVLGVDAEVTDPEQQAGFGPDDLAPFDTLNGIHVMAVKGLDIPYCQQVGRQWLLGQITDAEKDALVHSTIDSLFAVMRQAKAVYESGQFGDREASARFELEQAFRDAIVQGRLALSPPQPATFDVSSGVGKVDLAWTLNTTTGSSIAGWRVYRSRDFKGDSAWTMVHQAAPGELSWTDTGVSAGHSYFYYLTTFDAQGTESTMFTRTDRPAIVTKRFDGSVWTKANSPCHVTAPLVVMAGDTLEIEPGVVVIADVDAPVYPFEVYGTIRAVGTSTDSIRIMGGAGIAGFAVLSGGRIDFDYVHLSNPESGTVLLLQNARVDISHSVISGPRPPDIGTRIGSTTAIDAGASSVFLDNCRIKWCTSDAIRLVSSTAVIDSCIVDRVSGAGIEANTTALTVRNTVIHDCLTDGIDLASGTAEITNCTVVRNGNIGVDASPDGHATIRNTIVRDNRLGNVRQPPSAGNVTVTFSDIGGGWPGEGNLDVDPLFVDPAHGDFGLLPGSPCIDAGDPSLTDPDGSRSDMGAFPFVRPVAIAESASPPVFALRSAAPNPFNPSTIIRFSVAASGPAQLEVYDLTGRIVRTLVAGNLTAGPHEATWDGRDAAGRPCASGTYVYRLASNGNVRVRRMSLVR